MRNLYDTRFGLDQNVVDYLNQLLPDVSGIRSLYQPSVLPTQPVPEPENVGLTPEQLALLYPQYNLGNNEGDGDDGNTNVIDTTNNAGINSLGDLMDFAKSRMTPGNILSTAFFGPVPTLAYNIGKSIFGGPRETFGPSINDFVLDDARTITKDLVKTPQDIIDDRGRGTPTSTSTSTSKGYSYADTPGGGRDAGGGGARSGGSSSGGTSSTNSGMGGLGFSDIRLKENVKLIGKSPSNINIYKFNYKDNPTTYQGAMAHEVPWASVKHSNGYMMVDYSKLDVQFKKL